MVKAVGSRGVAGEVRAACAKGLANLVHALSLRPPERLDHANPSQVRGCHLRWRFCPLALLNKKEVWFC